MVYLRAFSGDLRKKRSYAIGVSFSTVISLGRTITVCFQWVGGSSGSVESVIGSVDLAGNVTVNHKHIPKSNKST